MKVKITIFFLLLMVLPLKAGVHFVSKTGSSIQPFATWATASDSIQKAINICKPGDTVFVGNGTYEETIQMTKGVSLIGSSMDSCTISMANMSDTIPRIVIQMADSCLVTNFTIVTVLFGSYAGEGMSILEVDGCRVEGNKFLNCGTGINIYDKDAIINGNIFINSLHPVSVWDSFSKSKPLIEENLITRSKVGVFIYWGSRSIIRKNIIYFDKDIDNPGGIVGNNNDSLTIENNLIVSAGTRGGGLSISNLRPSWIVNNTIYGSFGYGLPLEDNYVVKNNIFYLTSDHTSWACIFDHYHGELAKGYVCQYNSCYGKDNNYYHFKPDSTNLSVDPMFVNPDSLDFHLQKYSPLIDAGDPGIKDVDGTRSDMGIYGGPYGESYTYQDKAPRPPRNVTGQLKETEYILTWNKNTEADLAYYTVYRDTVTGFIADSTKRLKIVDTTTIRDIITADKNYYYKITATDKQGNESKPSEETGIITGVNNKPEIAVKEYMLYQNYPNPFNPSTKIGYRLKKAGHVKIAIYDIKGEKVTDLINENQSAGYHEVEFTGKRKNTKNVIESFASGIYLYRIEVKDENNIPIFLDMKKMAFIK